MGMFSEIVGYGIEFGHDCGSNTTVERIWEMLSHAPNVKREVEKWFRECDISMEEATVEDFAEFDQEEYIGIPALLVAVIKENYDISIRATSDDGGHVYVYMPKCFPWHMTDFEKHLTQDDFDGIIKKYYNMLYDDSRCIGMVSIEQAI